VLAAHYYNVVTFELSMRSAANKPFAGFFYHFARLLRLKRGSEESEREKVWRTLAQTA